MMAKVGRDPSFIAKVQDTTGRVVDTHSEVNATFQTFYEDVYSSKVTSASTATRDFLEGCNLPRLEQSDRDLLNTPLTTDELLEALSLSPPGKTLGADRLPAEVYKKICRRTDSTT